MTAPEQMAKGLSEALSAELAKSEAEVLRLREVLTQLIDHCWETEKALTEKGYRMDYCGESLPLTNAREVLMKEVG